MLLRIAFPDMRRTAAVEPDNRPSPRPASNPSSPVASIRAARTVDRAEAPEPGWRGQWRVLKYL